MSLLVALPILRRFDTRSQRGEKNSSLRLSGKLQDRQAHRGKELKGCERDLKGEC